MKNLALIISILLLMISTSYATTYKWKDATGKTHYSDVPPTSGAYETIGGRPASGSGSASSQSAPTSAPAPAAGSSDAQGAREGENPVVAKAREADKKRKQAEAKEEQDKIQKENCESTKTNLANLKSGDDIFMTKETGDRVQMKKEDVAQEIERAEKYIEKNCK